MPQPPVFVGAAFPLARCRRGLIYQAQDGCGCAVADDGSQRDAAGHGMGGGDAITGVGAMNRAPTRLAMQSPLFPIPRVRAGLVMPQPAGFVRAAFPRARCGRGLIHQTQNGCRCAVADDGSQRDAAGHGMGGGDGGNIAGAMNRVRARPVMPSPSFPVFCVRTGLVVARGWFFVRAAFPCARFRRGRKTSFCVPCGFGYAESADSCYTSRPWRVSPHCVAANLVRAGRQQP